MSKMKLNFDIPYKIIAKDKYTDIHFLLKPYFSWELIKINHKNSKSGFSDFSQWKLIYSFIHWYFIDKFFFLNVILFLL